RPPGVRPPPLWVSPPPPSGVSPPHLGSDPTCPPGDRPRPPGSAPHLSGVSPPPPSGVSPPHIRGLTPPRKGTETLHTTLTGL
ncbi:MAG: hypothetical protein LBD65_02005, partial [Spirochaetaceae bacterium]|nr:hypothetical protein [Spirochaetaceae bacterium]